MSDYVPDVEVWVYGSRVNGHSHGSSVEARDWARLPESFHFEIERDYVVLVSVK